MERKNLRSLRLSDIGGKPVDLVTLDLSFISGLRISPSWQYLATLCPTLFLGLMLALKNFSLHRHPALIHFMLLHYKYPSVMVISLLHNKSAVIKVLDAICDVLIPNGELLILVKPQFEAGKQQVGKWSMKFELLCFKLILHNTWDSVHVFISDPANEKWSSSRLAGQLIFMYDPLSDLCFESQFNRKTCFITSFLYQLYSPMA